MKHDWLNSFFKNLTPPLKNFTFHCQKTLFSNLIEPRVAQFELKLSSLLFDEEIKKILICETFSRICKYLENTNFVSSAKYNLWNFARLSQVRDGTGLGSI